MAGRFWRPASLPENPAHSFEFIIASSEYVFCKPNSRIFQLALEKAGLSSEDVWYVGDNYDCGDGRGLGAAAGIYLHTKLKVWTLTEKEIQYMQDDLVVLEELEEKAVIEDAYVRHTDIGLEILSYDRNVCKELILNIINNNMKEQKWYEKMSKQVIKVAVKRLSLENAETFLEAALEFKIININKWLSKQISKKINYILSDEKDRIIVNIHRLRCYKEEGMTLQIEIDEIDLNALFDMIIKEVKKSQIRNREENGKDGLGKSQFILFETLQSLNDSIPAEQKYKLVQMLLDWSNDNKVIPQIIDALAREDKDIERLKLKVGKITLEN